MTVFKSIPGGFVEAALDHTLNGICIMKDAPHLDDKKMMYVNDPFCQLCGYFPEELIGNSPANIIGNAHELAMEGEKETKMFPSSLKFREEKEAGTSVLCKLSRFTFQGQPYLIGTFQDLRELEEEQKYGKRLQQERSLLFEQIGDTTSRFAALLYNIPDLVIEYDQELVCTYISENVEQLLGYPATDFLGESLDKHMSEERREKFWLTFQDQNQFNHELRGLEVVFNKPDGKPVILEFSANPVLDSEGRPYRMIGTGRDITAIRQLENQTRSLMDENLIRVNKQLQLTFVSPVIHDLFPEYQEDQNFPEITQYLADPGVEPVFTFAFDQKENVPFPIEIKLNTPEGKPKIFSVQFQFSKKTESLEGNLIPSDTQEQVALVSDRIAKQEETLKASVMVDDETRENILTDSTNLAAEILVLIKELETFAFEEEDVFVWDNYKEFMRGKQIHVFQETLRLLGNKVHGLKGSSGFLIAKAKELCHRIEDLIHPLNDKKILLTRSVVVLFKEFIYKMQDMLEVYQKNPVAQFNLGNWLERVEKKLQCSLELTKGHTEKLSKFLAQREEDHGELRNRKEDYLSVSQSGYEQLSQHVKNLFYMISENLPEENIVQAGSIYNEFLDTHQRIKKVPLDLSRYERLIPSLANQYGKSAQFVLKDDGVRADREFWNAMHEIFNHALKNAVIHGLETIDDRQQANKGETGKVTVYLKEDALRIFITINDDGRGIDIEKVAQKAIEHKVITQERLNEMTREEILGLVFAQGVSTAETLDDNAGRGVGLNAVQEAMQKFRGTCTISSERGLGTTWEFIFPKSNVSLPCFIVSIGDFLIAIPEDHVEAFQGYNKSLIKYIGSKPTYQRADELIPLINSNHLFDEGVNIAEAGLQRILVLKTQKDKMGLIINDILHHATLPILPLPEDYSEIPTYLGITLHANSPILVLNTNRIG
ncbi:PAS domain S-box protein [Deltaproteobacteria bacterium TL4]